MSRASHPATVVALVVSGALIGTCVAAAITSLGGGSSLSSLGLPDPGVLTTYGLPVIRALTETAAMVTIGALLVTGVLSPTTLARTDGRGRIEVDPRAAGVASLSAALWAAGALLLVPLTVADSLGQPVAGLLSLTRLLVLVPHLATAQAWAQTALVAVAVGLWCRFARSWPSTLALAALAILGLLPVAATGHSSAGGAHDIATDSLMVHVVAASVWIGGLIALLRLAVVAGTSGRRLPLAARRFSAMALCCWLAMAVSGILNAAVRVRAADVFDTFYGRLVLAKAVCLLLLGGLGYLQRRRGLVGLAAGRAGSLVRLGGYEVLIMLGTLGLAVALGHSAPPSAGRVVVSRLAVSIGYDLPDPPSALALATGWRIDLIIGGGALVAALAYLHATRRPRHTARPWSRWRTLCWLAGCTLVVLATSSGLGRYARAMFSAALVQHTLLAVPAALLLVLGAPVALGRRILPIAAPDDPPAGGD
ncbi:MAG TPA: cytochrome c oxidase assembly protein, partial [Pseudonocardia sp.]